MAPVLYGLAIIALPIVFMCLVIYINRPHEK